MKMGKKKSRDLISWYLFSWAKRLYYVQRWKARIRCFLRLRLLSQNKWDKSSPVSPLLAWPTIILLFWTKLMPLRQRLLLLLLQLASCLLPAHCCCCFHWCHCFVIWNWKNITMNLHSLNHDLLLSSINWLFHPVFEICHCCVFMSIYCEKVV